MALKKMATKTIDNHITKRQVSDLTRFSIQEPKQYMIILHNDDYTPMDFVVEVLMKFFDKNEKEAERIMLTVHNKGEGIANIYPLEIAEMRLTQVQTYIYENCQPLQISIRPES